MVLCPRDLVRPGVIRSLSQRMHAIMRHMAEGRICRLATGGKVCTEHVRLCRPEALQHYNLNESSLNNTNHCFEPPKISWIDSSFC